MWTTSTIGGKMFLSIVAVWILLTVSAGHSSAAGVIVLPCCHEGSNKVPGNITECFEQKQLKGDCLKHFYVVVTEKGIYCINPVSKWLQQKMKKGNLKCSLPQMHRRT